MGADSRGAEIFCPVCGKATLVVRRPVYDGLRKVGETLGCSVCGTEFAEDEEIEFVKKEGPHVFSEEDGVRLCLHCVHYVVNPFTQRCMLHRKEVEATDSCIGFLRRKQKKKEEKKRKSSDALRKLFGEEKEESTTEET